jgi:hypothetical protein
LNNELKGLSPDSPYFSVLMGLYGKMEDSEIAKEDG